MKLLFDQNLSHRLCEELPADFQTLRHVRDLGLARATDVEIWNYARENEFTIVTKDSDFWERAVLDGPPPKVIWIRLGNCTTDDIRVLLSEHAGTIQAFTNHEDESLLPLGE